MSSRLFRLGVLVGCCVILMLPSPSVIGQTLTVGAKHGVGIVPNMTGGDTVEKQLYEIVGAMSEIDRVYTAENGNEMLNRILAVKNTGRKINYLVLAGHGSKNTPGIKWGSDDMIPEEVSLDWQNGQLEIAQRLLADPSKTNLTRDQIDARIREHSTRIQQLRALSDAMAPDAVVMLINCSAAATDKGRNFVQSLGKNLLGKRGGRIFASKTDISLNVRSSYLQLQWTKWLTGQDLKSGDLLIQADWTVFSFDVKYKKGQLLVGPVSIPAEKKEPTPLGLTLENERKYFVLGEGVCSLWDGQQHGCDSVFRYDTPLEINGGDVKVWGQLAFFDPNVHLYELIDAPVFNQGHVYEGIITGVGKELRARVHDGGGYSDNHGALTVSIFEAIPDDPAP